MDVDEEAYIAVDDATTSTITHGTGHHNSDAQVSSLFFLLYYPRPRRMTSRSRIEKGNGPGRRPDDRGEGESGGGHHLRGSHTKGKVLLHKEGFFIRW